MQNRKPLRLKDYNYSQDGCYFVTICTKDGFNYFGEIIDGKMELSEYGKIAYKNWGEIPKHFENIILDQFVVMPNHTHGIIMIIDNNVGNAYMRSLPKSRAKMYLSKIIQQYKSSVTRDINKSNGIIKFGWHKSFYDHIIRSEKDLMNTQAYIFYNPIKWEFDKENINNK